jgi:hypothetical protein
MKGGCWLRHGKEREGGCAMISFYVERGCPKYYKLKKYI